MIVCASAAARRGSATALVAVLLGACAAPAPAPASKAAATAPAVAPAVAPAAPTAAPTVATRGVAIENPGFESTQPGRRLGDPDGWFTFQHAGTPSYRFVVDTVEPHSGARSLRIDNIGPEPYGSVAQAVDVRPHAGKVARLSAWLKTRDANDEGARLTLVMFRGGGLVAHNFMADAPAKGTRGWNRHTISLPVPPGAERVEIGAMLQGAGTLWLDDVELEFLPP